MTYNIENYEDFVNIIENYNNGVLIRKSDYLSTAVKKFKEDNSYLKDTEKFIFDMDISSDDLYIISEDRVESKYRTLEDGWVTSNFSDVDNDIKKELKNFLMNELKVNSLQVNMIVNSFDKINIEESDYYSQYVVTYTFMKVDDLYQHLNHLGIFNNCNLSHKM